MSAPRDHLSRFQPKWPPELRERIRAAIEAGRSPCAVAHETGVPEGTIYYWIRAHGWRTPQAQAGAPTQAGPPAMPARRRAVPRDPLVRLHRSALDALALADAQIALLQAEPAGGDPERRLRLFAAYTAHVAKLTATVEKIERLRAERAGNEKKRHDAVPARSLDDVRKDFARRFLQYCRGRVSGIGSA